MTGQTKPFLCLFTATFIWGINPLINTILLRYGDPLTFNSIRYYLCSLTMFALLAYKKKFRLPSKRRLPYMILLGLFLVPLNNTLVLMGLQYSTVSHYALINALSPLVIALASYTILREPLDFLQWTGISVAVLSTLFLLTGGNITTIGQLQINNGDALFFCAQFAWAAYILIYFKKLKRVSSLELIAWAGFFGATINVLFGLATDSLSIPTFTPESVASLAYTTWLTAMAAMLLWNYGLKQVGPSVAGVFMNVATLIAVTSGVYFLDDPFSNGQAIGTVGVILGALLLAEHTHLLNFIRKIKQKTAKTPTS